MTRMYISGLIASVISIIIAIWLFHGCDLSSVNHHLIIYPFGILTVINNRGLNSLSYQSFNFRNVWPYIEIILRGEHSFAAFDPPPGFRVTINLNPRQYSGTGHITQFTFSQVRPRKVLSTSKKNLSLSLEHPAYLCPNCPVVQLPINASREFSVPSYRAPGGKILLKLIPTGQPGVRQQHSSWVSHFPGPQLKVPPIGIKRTLYSA